MADRGQVESWTQGNDRGMSAVAARHGARTGRAGASHDGGDHVDEVLVHRLFFDEHTGVVLAVST